MTRRADYDFDEGFVDVQVRRFLLNQLEWLTDYSPKEHWLIGYRSSDTSVNTVRGPAGDCAEDDAVRGERGVEVMVAIHVNPPETGTEEWGETDMAEVGECEDCGHPVAHCGGDYVSRDR